jgi:L-ascorbate metabolism protein UlaG (beta-lactamase superfamily)
METAELEDASFDLTEEVFLRSDVRIEPLLMRWYAWPHLISPAQHAMNIAFRHLPIMQSFIRNPSVHVAATRDPKLLGGPFITLPASDAPRVADLVKDTERRCASLIEFAKQFKAFDQQAQVNAKGFCLDELYHKTPALLKGLVELSYDLNNHVSVRVIEELMNSSEIDNEALQEIYLWRVKDSERPFFMSTPRIGSDSAISLDIRFRDEKIDALSAMRLRGTSVLDAVQAFGIGKEQQSKFATFFTPTATHRNAPEYHGDDVRIRYFGHAAILLQTRKTSVLIDPLIVCESSESDGRFSISDLPDFIDYLVISHAHQDHFCPEALLQLRHRVGTVVVPANNQGNIADPSMRLVLKRLGYKNIVVANVLEPIPLADGEIVCLPFPGEHADLDIHSKQSILINLRGRKFLFLVDSDAVDPDLFRRLKKVIGDVEVLFIGMECVGAPLTWLYGPLLTGSISRGDDESRRLRGSNCERAWDLVKTIGCKRVFVYAMGHESWLKYIMGLEYDPKSEQAVEADKFVQSCNQAGIVSERLLGCREFVFGGP